MAVSYQESGSSLPEWYNQGYHQMQNLGMAGLSTPFQGYSGQLVSGLMPLQNQAASMAQNLAGTYKPYLEQSGNLIGSSAQLSPTLQQNYNAMSTAGTGMLDTSGRTVSGALGMDLAGAGAGQYIGATNAITGAGQVDLAGAGAPLYGQARNLYSSGASYDPAELAKHFNPYVQNVVQELGRLGGEQFTNVINPSLTSSFQGLGQQGSARQAALLADAAAKSQREILGQQANALNTGFTQASQDYLNWAQQGTQAASGLANLGQQQYNQLLGQANLGLNVGQQLANIGQQQYTQQLGAAQNQLQGANQLASIGQQQIQRQQAASQLQEQGWQNYMGNQLNAGTAMGNLGQAVQQTGLADIGAVSAAGSLQQQNAQQYLDAQYNEFLRQQQYPFQQAQAYSQLFPAAPTTSSSWSTSFKKGGLARFADGGRFRDEWQIPEEVQAGRDKKRFSILASELVDNPDDQDLLDELIRAGATPEDIDLIKADVEKDQESGSMIPVSPRGDLPPMLQSLMGQDKRDQQAQMSLAQQAMSQRQKLLDQISTSGSLSPMKEPSLGEKLGRAMMEASAQGPAHWGQLIGRSGAAYYASEDAREKENQARELARIKIQESLIPDVSKLSRSSSFKFSKFGQMLVEMGYTPGTPEFNSKMQELMTQEQAGGGELSVAGRIARDEGYKPGTPEYGRRVNEIVERELGVKEQGVEIRRDTAGTYRGNLDARNTDLGLRYGPTGLPSPAAPTRQSGLGGASGLSPQISSTTTTVPQAQVVSTERPGSPYVQSQGEEGTVFDVHPGVLKYENQGLPRARALERWDEEQKGYDKLLAERDESGISLTATDLGRADILNEEVYKKGIVPPVLFNAPYSSELSAIVSDTGEKRAELNALGARMIPALTKGLTPVSNVDAQSMAKAGIGAQNSYVVNKTNIQRARSSLLLVKEQDNFYAAAQAMGLGPAEAKTEWNNYIKSNPMFNLKRVEKTGALHYNIPLEERNDVLNEYINGLQSKHFEKLQTRGFSPKPRETSADQRRIEVDW